MTTLCDYSLADSSVHGILLARILEWVAIPFSRESSQPRDQTHISWVSCIAGGFCTIRATREALVDFIINYLTLRRFLRSVSVPSSSHLVVPLEKEPVSYLIPIAQCWEHMCQHPWITDNSRLRQCVLLWVSPSLIQKDQYYGRVWAYTHSYLYVFIIRPGLKM